MLCVVCIYIYIINLVNAILNLHLGMVSFTLFFSKNPGVFSSRVYYVR